MELKTDDTRPPYHFENDRSPSPKIIELQLKAKTQELKDVRSRLSAYILCYGNELARSMEEEQNHVRNEMLLREERATLMEMVGLISRNKNLVSTLGCFDRVLVYITMFLWAILLAVLIGGYTQEHLGPVWTVLQVSTGVMSVPISWRMARKTFPRARGFSEHGRATKLRALLNLCMCISYGCSCAGLAAAATTIAGARSKDGSELSPQLLSAMSYLGLQLAILSCLLLHCFSTANPCEKKAQAIPTSDQHLQKQIFITNALIHKQMRPELTVPRGVMCL